MKKNNAITRLDPKNIVNPTIKTIPLTAVKKLHDKEMQGYDDTIERLQAQLDEANRTIAKTRTYQALGEALSLKCAQLGFKKITILECTERRRAGKCVGTTFSCHRKAILRKLGAREA